MESPETDECGQEPNTDMHASNVLASNSTMLRKAGFFHFGIGHEDPKAALEDALKDAQTFDYIPQDSTCDPAHPLVVLPEAFNIGVSRKLHTVSEERRLRESR